MSGACRNLQEFRVHCFGGLDEIEKRLGSTFMGLRVAQSFHVRACRVSGFQARLRASVA